jgi:uncharacterized membrane protein YbhN (UPF0104 family)
LKNKKLYKYINLLVRLCIGIGAVCFIYFKLKDDFLEHIQFLSTNKIDYYLLLIVIFLMPLNWGVEAFKWKYAIQKIEKISFYRSLKLTLIGITLSLFTPNRVGEIPARAMILNKSKFKELTLRTIITSYSQLLITILMGCIGFILTINQFALKINSWYIIIGVSIVLIFLFLIYFKINRLEKYLTRISYFKKKKIFSALTASTTEELMKILVMSFIRYLIFFLQFYLVLRATGVLLFGLNEIMLISVCFMFSSVIPTLLISEIGVRGSVSLFVFGLVSDMDVQIILASVLLWVINVIFPALYGVFNLKHVKILKES